MSRYRKKSPADEMFNNLVEISSLLPWWVSVGVAALLFIFIPFNILGTADSAPLDQFGDQATRLLMGIMLGGFLKYFIPLALFIGGLTNLFKRGKSAWMFKNISTKGARDTLRKLSWKDFEFLISEYFKKQGYGVDLIDAKGADGGIDVKLYKDNNLYLVQCKHYKAWKVSVQIVRELYGLMAAEKATGGFIVTTGKFTKDALAFAEGKQVELIGGIKLEKILNDDLSNIKPDNTESKDNKDCPKCGHKLVGRNGSRGKFIGCSFYPKCRYTRDL